MPSEDPRRSRSMRDLCAANKYVSWKTPVAAARLRRMAFPGTDYRRLVETSPDAILISRDNRIVFVNPAAVRLFGGAAAEDLWGMSPLDVFHPDSHAPIRHRMERQLAGEPMPLIDVRIVRLDGTRRT